MSQNGIKFISHFRSFRLLVGVANATKRDKHSGAAAAVDYETFQHFSVLATVNHFTFELEKKRLGNCRRISTRKMLRTILLICAVSFLVQWDTEASTIRSSLIDNLNSGLKMLGKNDRRMSIRHPSIIHRLPSGISNKVAELVSQSFAPAKSNVKRVNFRQDAIILGEDIRPSLENSSLMGGMLKLLGLDSSKIGAAAMNGIIFIAQMVRYSASRVMDFMMVQTADFYKVVDYIGERIKTDQPGVSGVPGVTVFASPPPTTGRIIVPMNGKILVYNRI